MQTPKILIVDDDPLNLDLLERVLKKSKQNWRQLSPSLELWRMDALSRFVVAFVSQPEGMKQGLKP